MTDSSNALEKMIKTLEIHDRLCGAAGRTIELSKTNFYAWVQKWKQGQKVAKKIELNLEIRNS